MCFKYHGIGFLALVANLLPAIAHSAACIASADSLSNAKAQYMASCTLPLEDCDPIGGTWFCSSESVSNGNVASVLQTTALSLTQSASQPASVGSVPEAGSCIDEDQDGWGWDGVRSCNSATQSNEIAVEPRELPVISPQQTQETCLDPDGDGWGWNGVRSCISTTPINSASLETSESSEFFDNLDQQAQETCLDPDGDGWGWNGMRSCKSATRSTNTSLEYSEPAVNTNQQTPNPLVSAFEEPSVNQPATTCSGTYAPSDITDLVLITGQSNVLGAETSVSATQDRWGKVIEFLNPDKPHPRAFAWTVDANNNNAGEGWQVAALNQSWHDGAPGVGGIAHNSFAFHFAKQVAQRDACRVVGFVVVSEGGKGISHWDSNAQGWREVVQHVTEAMSSIGRTSIDGILWHQGESDWIVDGTCFTGARCRNGQPDYYPQKLYSRIADRAIPNPVGNAALIDRFRRQSWFGADKPFIAGETIKAPVNMHLNKLNTDSDRFTSCISSSLESGLGIRENDPHQNHYSAAGLRELGTRYAAEYLKMTN